MTQFPDNFDPAVNPSRPTPDLRRWFWSDSQRRVLAILVLVAVGVLALSVVRRPAIISDPAPSHPALYDDLQDRLDPNTASAAELAVLPGIGPSKAQAILDYRAAQPMPAFRQPMDLTRVHGIGEVTAAKLAPYLHFAEARPASQPSTLKAVRQMTGDTSQISR